MTTNYEAFRIHSLCEELFAGIPSLALLTPEGQTVYLRYQNLADIGTLPQAAQTSHKYLQIEDGDIVITNDPYSGGSVLSSINLVLGVQPQRSSTKKTSQLLICQRLAFKPKLSLGDSIEDEGLRIPPTPLRQGGKLNAELLEVIGHHPLAPQGFRESLERAIEGLLRTRERLRYFTEVFAIDWSKPAMRKFFQKSNQLLRARLGEIAVGESLHEMTVDARTRMRLRMDVSESKVVFDFTGTDASPDVHLTDAATFGACMGALAAVIGGPLPLNSGVFESIEVLSPQGTLVNARYPKPVFQGMTDGTALIANLVLKVIGMVDPKHQVPLSGASQCSFQLDFANGRWFYETLDAGAPALEGRPGVDGLNLWRRSHLDPSVEEIERRYPLLVKSYAFRLNSGGSGAHVGGNGITKTVKVLEPAKLKWIVTEPTTKPEGAKGGKSASQAEVLIQESDGEKEKAPLKGERAIAAGTVVTLHSAGGGGFGDVE